MKLDNKVIVITGSTRGIGRAIAKACAEEGGKVVICSRNKEAVEETCNSIARKGFKATGIAIDVSNENEVRKLFDHALKIYGTIDVWINNAGLSAGYRMLHDLSESEIRNIIDVNITGTLQACKMVIPFFIQNKKGILINISGKGGRGEAAPYLTTYAATKAAVTSLTKSLAKEYKAYPISIHSVFPGMVETDFYKDIKVSPNLAKEVENIPLLLKVFGVPKERVAKAIVDIAAQEPGERSGKQYSLMGGVKTMKAMLIIIWYRLTGKFGSKRD